MEFSHNPSRKDTLAYVARERCPAYLPAGKGQGICGINKSMVNAKAGCYDPKNCRMLKSRGIEVTELLW